MESLSEAMGLLVYGMLLLVGFGTLYWLWMAIQLGSFAMFAIGVLPLSITGSVGAWSLLFGTPDWIVGLFS